MQLITKIRVGVLLAAALIFTSGLKAAVHPRLILVSSQPTPMSGNLSSEGVFAEFVTSKGSRFFGILRMAVGGGLGLYVLFSWRKDWSRHR